MNGIGTRARSHQRRARSLGGGKRRTSFSRVANTLPAQLILVWRRHVGWRVHLALVIGLLGAAQTDHAAEDFAALRPLRVTIKPITRPRGQRATSCSSCLAAASAVSSGRVLNAIVAFGAALWMMFTTVSNNARLLGGSLRPPPITTQS